MTKALAPLKHHLSTATSYTPLNTLLIQHNGKPESIGYALKGLVTLVPYRDLKTGELVKLQGISGIKATDWQRGR
jgi:hypothetical protein